MTRRPRVIALLAIAAAGFAASAGAASPPFEGKVVVKGKSYDLKYAWMVRGATKMSPNEVKTYVIAASEDVSEKIRKCEEVVCAIWDSVPNGIVIEPDTGGWWILVHDPDRKPSQFSGPTMHGTGWTETASTPDRLAGRLVWKPMGDDPIFDFKVDAPLLKEFKKPPTK